MRNCHCNGYLTLLCPKLLQKTDHGGNWCQAALGSKVMVRVGPHGTWCKTALNHCWLNDVVDVIQSHALLVISEKFDFFQYWTSN